MAFASDRPGADGSQEICDELKVLIKSSGNLPKKIDFISEFENNKKDLSEKESQKDYEKKIFSLPELNESIDTIKKLLADNESLSLGCLYNINQIKTLKSKTNATSKECSELSQKIIQLQKELPFDKIDQWYRAHEKEYSNELKQLEQDVIDKKIEFDEYFNKFKNIKLKLTTNELLQRIYKNRFNNS